MESSETLAPPLPCGPWRGDPFRSGGAREAARVISGKPDAPVGVYRCRMSIAPTHIPAPASTTPFERAPASARA